HFHKPANPITLRDWKAALDCTVIKQGVFCLVFHPYNWIKPEQVVELIDHAVGKHGKKVKFLTFKEAQERLNKNMLGGVPLRDPKTGRDNGVTLADSNDDGYLDVFIRNDKVQKLRVWQPGKGWKETDLSQVADLGSLRAFKGFDFVKVIRLGDTRAYVVANAKEQAVILKSGQKLGFERAGFSLPRGAWLGDETQDNGLRFVDIDEDGYDDIIWSNDRDYGLYLFDPIKGGWTRKVLEGKAGDKNALPLISRN